MQYIFISISVAELKFQSIISIKVLLQNFFYSELLFYYLFIQIILLKSIGTLYTKLS